VEASIRFAHAEDASAMVDLSEQQRLIDEARYQLKFYRKAADSREKQLPYFESLLARKEVIALVSERDSLIDGFIIGMAIDAPPVYDPGGSTCLVDDFVVQRPQDWSTVGVSLLRKVNAHAKERGAVQTVVICRRLDEAKRAALVSLQLALVSEWYVAEL
jgi:hypothetical protein